MKTSFWKLLSGILLTILVFLPSIYSVDVRAAISLIPPPIMTVPANDIDGNFTVYWSAPNSGSGSTLVSTLSKPKSASAKGTQGLILPTSQYSYVLQQSFNGSGWLTRSTTSTFYSFRNLGVGTHSFRVKACEGLSCSKYSASKSVLVGASTNPPVISQGSSYSFSAHGGEATPFVLSATDIENDPLTWSLKNSASHGSVTGFGSSNSRSFSYTSDSDYIGSDSFIIQVSDGSLIDEISVSVNIIEPAWAEVGEQAVTNAAFVSASPTVNESVGALAGSAGVSGGAASYSIPIALPPGRAGMQPNVSLNYSSKGGNGIAGVGWSLSAGSSIHRCAQTVAQDNTFVDVNYSTDDKLCLDGQRLIVVNNKGYGTSGAKYRTESDSFVLVTQSGGINGLNTSFTVELKNGQINTYGASADSTNARHNAEGRNETLTWAIAQSADPSGNYMTYSYSDDGEFNLENISYTGYNATPGNRKVSFVYQDRVDANDKNDFQFSYQAGGKTSRTQRLASIQTYIGTTLIREYSLTYGAMSLSSGRSILRSVQECVDKNSQTFCLPETSFNWQEAETQFELVELNNAADGYISEMKQTGDFDGDGRKEYLVYGSTNALVSFDADGNMVEWDISNIIGADSSTTARMSRFQTAQFDWNNDGRTDLLHYDDSGQLVISVVNLQENQPVALSVLYEFNQLNTEIPNIYNPDGNIVEPGLQSRVTFNPIDFDNDGLMDLWRLEPSSDNTVTEYNIYYNSGTAQMPEFKMVNKQTIQDFDHHIYHWTSAHEDFTGLAFRDINGDGLTDLVASQGGCMSTKVEDKVWINQGGRNNFQETAWGSSGIGLDDNNLPQDTYHMWADINGDGLLDYLFVPNGLSEKNNTAEDATWHYQLNKGNHFEAVVDTQQKTGLTGFGGRGQVDITGLDWCTGESSPNTPQYTPRFSSVMHTTDFNADGAADLVVATNKEPQLLYCRDVEQGKSAWPTENDVPNVDDLVLLCPNRISEDSREMYDEGLGGIDRSLYNTLTYSFEFDISKGKFQLNALPGSERLARANSNHEVDPYGDGLTDYIFRVGQGEPTRPQSAGFSFTTLSGENREPGLYLYRSLGASTDGVNAKLPDVIASVENGLKVKSSWNYLPLTSSENRGAYIPSLYSVPQTDEEREIDADHFYFTSSMYVVSSLKQSDGVGGDNETFYSYRDAMYNNKGRGFQGFKQIIVDAPSEVRSVTDFRQDFPYAGKVSEVRTCLMTDNDETCAVSPLSISTIDYLYKNTANNDIYWVIPTNSVSESYALNNRSKRLSQSITTIALTDTDDYGNIKKSESIIDNGFSRVKTLSENVFIIDENSWWINKLDTSTVTNETLTGSALHDPALDIRKKIETRYTWTANRQPNIVTMTPLQGGGKVVAVDTDYNGYGLPTSVKTITDGQTRKVTTTYSTDHYFVKTTTNDLSHVVTTTMAPEHGQVIEVIDANGLVTTSQYDAFGRVEQVTPPIGQPAYSRFAWCQSNCDGLNTSNVANIQYKVTTYQAGSPESTVYKDSYNRVLLAKTEGFNGDNIYVTTEYDHLGRTVFTSIPSFDSLESKGTHFNTFDGLSRLTEKVVDQALNQQMTVTYSHNGETTNIQAITSSGTRNLSRTYSANGQLMKTVQENNGIDVVTEYAYDSMGNPIVLQDANGNAIEADYNALGQKLEVNDPNMGVKSFSYTGFGEVDIETDANGDSYSYDYDILGRLATRKLNGSTEATYRFDGQCNGAIDDETRNDLSGSNNYQRAYTYDANNCLPIGVTTTIDSVPYVMSTQYDDNYGRPKAVTYPNNLTVQTLYNDRGYATHSQNAISGYIYHEAVAMDARLQLIAATKADGKLDETFEYAPETGQMLSVYTDTNAGDQRHRIDYIYEGFGNLQRQTVENIQNGSPIISFEDYAYDDLHRLTNATRTINGTQQTAVTYDYDDVGNFIKKSDYATSYSYGNATKSLGGNAGSNAVRRITKSSQAGGGTATYSYDLNGNLTSGDGKTLTYNAFNKPVTISKNGVTSSFSYGADQMRYKQIKTVPSEETETTIYIDKAYEVVTQGSVTKKRAYLGDAIITETVGGTEAGYKIGFVHRDRLNSVVTITDENGNLLDNKSYDAFGKPRKGSFDSATPATLAGVFSISDFTTGSASAEFHTTRGFTDHEHLDDAELIHMNGRVYDYNLGRFLSVDPFIQEPGNSQSMNPYSYIMNNPLAGTDPSGYTAEKSCGEQTSCVETEEAPEKKSSSGGGLLWDFLKGRGAKKNGAAEVASTKAKKVIPAEQVGGPKVISTNINGLEGKAEKTGAEVTGEKNKDGSVNALSRSFTANGVKINIFAFTEENLNNTEEQLFKILNDEKEGGNLFNGLKENGLKEIRIYSDIGIKNVKGGYNFSTLTDNDTVRNVFFETTSSLKFVTTKKRRGTYRREKYSWQRKFTHEFIHAALNSSNEKDTITRTNNLKSTWGGKYDRHPDSHGWN